MTGMVLSGLVGALAVAWMPSLPTTEALVVLLLLAVLCWRFCSQPWLVGVLLGALLFCAHGRHYLETREQLVAVNKAWFTATVIDIPRPGRYGDRFILRSDQGFKLLSRWQAPPQTLAPGQRWRLLLAIRPSSGLRNPGSFDRERWAMLERVHATAKVIEHADNRLLQAGGGIDHGRAVLARKIDASLPAPAAALAAALVVGDRSGLDANHWRVMANTGTVHLMAISGLHIGLVALLGWWLGGILFACCTPLICSKLAVRSVCAMLPAVCYATLAGWSLPTQRAVLMLALSLGAILLRRPNRPWLSLLGVLGLTVMIDPLAILSRGFWLSFGAVAALFAALLGRLRLPRWRRAWTSQLAIGAGLLPLAALLGLPLNPWACLLNLLAIPCLGLLVLPPLLLGVMALPVSDHWASLCWQLAAFSLDSGWQALQWAADATVPWWLTPASGPLLCATLAALVLLSPPYVLPRNMAAVLLLPILLTSPPRPQLGQAWIHILDVGQGLAVVVQTHRHTWLYDTGPGHPQWDAGGAVILPFLRQRGLNRIDQVIISHMDNDHAGGWRGLSGQLADLEPIGSGPGLTSCLAGQEWRLDGLRLRILHPGPGLPYLGNDSSCVVVVQSGDTAFLLSGDISTLIEQRLLRQTLPVAGLLVPHHGSLSSSSPAFIDHLSPGVALISAGFNNRFALPHEDVIQRYRRAGTELWNTADCGYIRLSLTAHGLKVVHRERVEGRRWWQRHDRCGQHNG